MNDELKREIGRIVPEVRYGEVMSGHTTFRIGGAADAFAEVSSAGQISELIKLLNRYGEPYMIVGKGSNLLVSDRGIRGTVVHIGKGMSKVETDGTLVRAQGGAALAEAAAAAAEAGLTGLEFAAGIPGSVGGGIYMNAGAYGGELADVLAAVTYIDEDANLKKAVRGEMDMAYRHSMFSDRKCAIVGCVMELEKGDREQIYAQMRSLAARRRDKQPLEYPSAGSTFKRPQGYFAGKLIQDAGLMGASIGGAQVSQKHAGFIINKGGATSDDVEKLIKYVQDEVKRKFGVELEPEVRVTEHI